MLASHRPDSTPRAHSFRSSRTAARRSEHNRCEFSPPLRLAGRNRNYFRSCREECRRLRPSNSEPARLLHHVEAANSPVDAWSENTRRNTCDRTRRSCRSLAFRRDPADIRSPQPELLSRAVPNYQLARQDWQDPPSTSQSRFEYPPPLGALDIFSL